MMKLLLNKWSIFISSIAASGKNFLKIIERVEVNLRCRISNHFSCKYGVLGYENPDNFQVPEFHAEFLNDIN